VFVQLQDIFVDGLVHVTRLGNDYYHFDPVYQKLQGERSGQVFKLGDRVKVIVAGVDLEESKIDFELWGNTASRDGKPPGRKHRKRNKSNSRKPKH
jgi:ribonuclease R